MENGKYDLEDLKEQLLDKVSPEEIERKNLDWCLAKWYQVTACTLGNLFINEVYEGQFYGLALSALSRRIEALGGKVTQFVGIELPKKLEN